MNLQKTNKTIRQNQGLPIEEEKYIKDFRKPKREKETRKYYKCNKIGHLVKNCRLRQKLKNRSITNKILTGCDTGAE